MSQSKFAVTDKSAGALAGRFAWLQVYRDTKSPNEVCRRFGISRKTLYKWLRRFKESGGSRLSLLDQSRRPHTFPRATPATTVALIMSIKKETGYGQRKLKQELLERHDINVSERTIWKIVKNASAGLSQPNAGTQTK
jgi:transposase